MARKNEQPVMELPSVEEQRAFTSRTASPIDEADITTVTTRVQFADGRPQQAAFGQITKQQKERGRPTDARYMQLVFALEQRHKLTGISSITIINMLPIPLVVNSPMATLRHVVPACPRGQLFTMHTWDKADIQPLYAGEGVSTPWDFLPEQLAQAYIDEHRAWGGVCMIRATPEEILAIGGAIEEYPEFKAARNKMYEWCGTLMTEAWNYYNTPNHQGAVNIVEKHRAAAHILRDAGLLPQDPPWMEIYKDVDNLVAKCPVCKLDPLRGAVKCQCGYVMDPYGLFMAGGCEETDLCLERLTRAQVEDLGISKYVAETSDEKDDRRKKGLPKPLSEAQRIMMALEDIQVAQQQQPSQSGPDMSRV